MLNQKTKAGSPLASGDVVNAMEQVVMNGGMVRRSFLKTAMAFGMSGGAAAAMALHAESVWANQSKLGQSLKEQYDYIVVGGGSSGSVVASRLSENPDVQVLLLEAGGTDEIASIQQPALWPTNLGSDRDWGDKSVPQAHMNNRVINLAMGRALGGGSSINVMAYARGHKNDYDHWASEAGDRTGITSTSCRSTSASKTGRERMTRSTAARAVLSGCSRPRTQTRSPRPWCRPPPRWAFRRLPTTTAR